MQAHDKVGSGWSLMQAHKVWSGGALMQAHNKVGEWRGLHACT